MKKKLASYPDIELLKMLQKEKTEAEAAFTEIYDRYSTRLNAYCIRITGDPEQACDIFQETFYKFFMKASADKCSGSIIGFLITIARNLYLNQQRGKKTTIPIEEFEEILPAIDNSPDMEMVELVKMAIDLLGPDYREPLIMKVYSGMEYAEIGDICGISTVNARSRVFRARQKLKEILTPYIKDTVS